MVDNDKYGYLTGLIRSRFHEDFDIFGNSVEELVSSYIEKMPKSEIDALISDIDSFKADFPDTLDSEFNERYGSQFDPVLWGHTTASFLDEVKRLLSE
ncbi:contact-dependent growth inhibition system immunity protein [Paraburkholderia ferrariae]|uniref:contact-dependent growth inhibition system immunity protein n=1 Tax=Paraburkholderia ferrariae TaxID=386056 RepID=UPI000A00E60F|nr:contact-dependent growth inhibition system immunity protein [Paraburkholderia ferrariae]